MAEVEAAASDRVKRAIVQVRAVRLAWEFDIKHLFNPSDQMPSDLVWGSLANYIRYGQPIGDFLTAVLRNDLSEAISRADHTNRYALPALCMFLYNRAPSICWGSESKIRIWREAHEIVAAE